MTNIKRRIHRLEAAAHQKEKPGVVFVVDGEPQQQPRPHDIIRHVTHDPDAPNVEGLHVVMPDV